MPLLTVSTMYTCEFLCVCVCVFVYLYVYVLFLFVHEPFF